MSAPADRDLLGRPADARRVEDAGDHGSPLEYYERKVAYGRERLARLRNELAQTSDTARRRTIEAYLAALTAFSDEHRQRAEQFRNSPGLH